MHIFRRPYSSKHDRYRHQVQSTLTAEVPQLLTLREPELTPTVLRTARAGNLQEVIALRLPTLDDNYVVEFERVRQLGYLEQTDEDAVAVEGEDSFKVSILTRLDGNQLLSYRPQNFGRVAVLDSVTERHAGTRSMTRQDAIDFIATVMPVIDNATM